MMRDEIEIGGADQVGRTDQREERLAAQVAGVQNALATAIGGSVQFANCTILGADYA